MANLAIRGHATRGKEVIEILEMLGGKNPIGCNGSNQGLFHFVDVKGDINTINDTSKHLCKYELYTLEAFLEKFPYKVGDKVALDKWPCEVISMSWDDNYNEIVYCVKGIDFYKNANVEDLQPYKEEVMEETIKIDIPKGYEFTGVDNDKQQIVFTKIQPHYPKTYGECCKILGCKADNFFTNFDCNGCDVEISEYEDKVDDLLQIFRKLRYCRDAYWKLYGERMGLGKPWKPEKAEIVHAIFYDFYDDVIDVSVFNLYDNVVLCFPTEEMRDAFLENFGHLIELCKELL